jgi:hypothetical protein
MCKSTKGIGMKRIFTLIILGHWLLFFVLHSLGALAGSITIASMSGLSKVVGVFGAEGAMNAMPLISAGMGTASLLVATLFLWAFLASLVDAPDDANDGDIENIAFGGAALVFTMLSAMSIVDADPTLLLSSIGYFAALVLSWLACKVQSLQSLLSASQFLQSPAQAYESNKIARAMASSAAHQNLLAKIAGRERS